MTQKAASVAEVVARITEVLDFAPSALLSDFDGTLSPIAPTPEAAQLHPDLVDILPVLAEQDVLFGVITGRAVADVRAKIGLDDMLYVGNHGLEWVEDGEYRAHPAGVAAEQAIATALEAIQQDLAQLDRDLSAMVFEFKRYSAAIHYRLVPDVESCEAHIAAITQRRADEFGLRMTTGKMEVELRPQAEVSKGSAVEELVASRGLKGVVFLGDDITDIDGFDAVTRLRDTGTLSAGLSVGVISADAHPSIAEHADLTVRNVEEIAAILAGVIASRSAIVEGEVAE